MSGEYVIKVSKKGKSVHSTDLRDLDLTSKNNMLKFHSVEDSSFTFTPGDSEKYVDIVHGLVDSLGNPYTPAFIPYAQDLDDPTKLRFIGATPPVSLGLAYWAYADNTKIRIGLALIGTAYNNYSDDPSDWWSTFYNNNSSIEVGNEGGSGTDGAFRFTAVDVPQGATITSASITFHVGVKGAGAGDLAIKTYGIDEDNTSDFGSSPMGRSRTTAETTQTVSLPPAGQNFGITVTSQVQEIVDRGGWASGNAMGFLIINNSSPADVWVFDSPSGTNSSLSISYGGNQVINVRAIIFKDKVAQ